jgi:hypothetical protein
MKDTAYSLCAGSPCLPAHNGRKLEKVLSICYHSLFFTGKRKREKRRKKRRKKEVV